MLRYYKLFDLLMRKGMKKTELLKVISSGSLAKLGKGENIQTEIREEEQERYGNGNRSISG